MKLANARHRVRFYDGSKITLCVNGLEVVARVKDFTYVNSLDVKGAPYVLDSMKEASEKTEAVGAAKGIFEWEGTLVPACGGVEIAESAFLPPGSAYLVGGRRAGKVAASKAFFRWLRFASPYRGAKRISRKAKKRIKKLRAALAPGQCVKLTGAS